MLAVEINGRLGNQLFQYAFGFSLAKESDNHIWFLAYYHQEIILFRYFKIPFYFWFFNTLFNKLYLIGVLKLKDHNLSNDLDPRQVNQEILKAGLYHGFFQSELYFEKYSRQILNHFRLRSKYRKEYEAERAKLSLNNVKTLVIHFRGGDYKVEDRISSSFYNNAIANVNDIEKYKIILLGDYEEYDTSYFPNSAIRLKGKEIIDFQFIMNADVAIISNSSYAWWGAYLNTGNPVVYAPKFWLGYQKEIEYPNGIMSIGWNWIK